MTRPNILLIILDATRADACSCYGAGRETTPHLDALASEGTLYEQAITPAPWTLPAMASVFTGLYPSQIGVYETRRLDESVPTLAGVLAGQGYRTFGVTGNSWMSADFGLQRGFQQMHKLWQLFQSPQDINRLVLLNEAEPHRSWVPSLLSQWFRGNPVKNVLNTLFNRFWSYRRDFGAHRTARPLLNWLNRQDGPWFAFVHYLEAHLEYKPPQAWARRFARDRSLGKRLLAADQMRLAWRHMAGVETLSEEQLEAWRDLYLAEVAYTDHHMGQLLVALQAAGHLDNTLVMVTADHGESLGEHGLLNHQYGVYDTLLHVPLILRFPGRFEAGKRVPWAVQTLDLFPTALEAAQAERPPNLGQSLMPSTDGPRPFVVAEYGVPRTPHAARLRQYGLQAGQLERFRRGFTTIRTETHKLILGTDGSTQLYAWRDDPGELQNLAAGQPNTVQMLRSQLQSFQEQHGLQFGTEAQEDLEIDATVASRLQALGYLD